MAIRRTTARPFGGTRRGRGDARRRDVQGLRAIAVVAVVVSHFWGWPRGGFVGVDVFFVISGFLITGHLVREHARTGRISFVDFYAKRVRRIAPAAAVVLLVTVVASTFLLNPNRASDVQVDGLWAAVFLANWHFAQTGTDYFTADGPLSPLQHFWSLAIEEQFYAVWPLLIVFVLRSTRRGGPGNPTGRLVRLCGLVIVLSLCWAVWSTHAAPTSAYFSTGTRAWELGCGALLAVGAGPFRQLSRWAREILAWAGFAAIVVAIVITDGARGFPFPMALLPTLGTVLVIAAGIGSEPRTLFVLRNPLSDYLGRVSYSLYLWHFPVLVLAVPVLGAVLGRSNPAALVVALLLAAALAVCSFHFVEEPVRRSQWLAPRPGRRRRLPVNVVVTISVAAAAVLSSGAALTVDGRSSRSAVSEFSSARTPDVDSGEDTETGSNGDQESAQAAITALVNEANTAAAWPDGLVVNDPDAPDALPGAAGICGSGKWLDARECTIGAPDAPKTAVLAGDSIAQAYTPALAKLYGTGEWKLRMVSMYACPFVALELGDQQNRVNACQERKKLEVEEIERLQPDVLIVANTYIRNKDRAGERPSVGEWAKAVAAQLSLTSRAAKRTFYLLPPPQTPDVRECYTPLSTPKDCAGKVSDTDWRTMARAQTVALRDQDVSVIDPLPWFCTTGGSCPAFGGTAMMRNDSWHPSPAWTAAIAPAMREAFAAASGPGR